MEKEKKTNLLVGAISAITGAIIGASVPIIINKVKCKKQKENKETATENITKLTNNDKKQMEKNVKEAEEKLKSVDQLFLVPVKKEYIEKIGFGVIGAIKTLSGEDDKGKYNSRMIIGLNTMLEVKEYDGKIEGFSVFKNDNDARSYVNKFISDKKIINAKNKKECISRLISLLQDNKEYEENQNN